MDRLLRAAIHSWHGLCDLARSEPAFRQELVALMVAVPLAFLIAEEAWKRLALIGVVLLVLVVELLNTAIEKLADRVSRESDAAIGRVKDMGSAAVGLALLIAGLAWLLALVERIFGK
jgi:diacylglycerol kinase (ATP)